MNYFALGAAVLSVVALTGWTPDVKAEPAIPLAKPDAAVRAAPPAAARIGDPKATAKQLFSAASRPAPIESRSIGSYARGCLAGGEPLAADGPSWQVIRLSRNRNWGHPDLIKYMERLAADAPKLAWRGLMVGDMAQPRGGPMPSGHASHQIGLDADIWLLEMPKQRLSKNQREKVSAVSMLREGTRKINPDTWSERHARLIRRAASDRAVARIFVHPTIKQALCDWAKGDRSWLRRIRPWYRHHYHFHVRLSCPKGLAGCTDQAAPPPGDGCGKAMAWWFTEAPWRPAKPGGKKRREMRLSDLPKTCSAVLAAQ